MCDRFGACQFGHASFLFMVDCFGFVTQTLFSFWKYFIEFASGVIAPEFLPDCANVRLFTLDLRFD